MRVLVANTGSSSLKLRLVGPDGELLAKLDAAAPGDRDAIARFAGEHGADAVGHRIVHGRELRDPALLDADGIEELRRLTDLAPLHNGPALRLVETLRRLLPDVPHVACFDTAFHAGMPDAAALYALPREWIERHGLRRYGFHGLSHSWASRRAAELLGRPPRELRLVTCHLGAGASLAAVHGGRSVDTTMGFTPNEGLVMATRSGSVDPGLLLWLIRDAGIDPDELEDALEHRSGLAGLSGTSDMRELLGRLGDDERSRAAFDVYVHRLRSGIAAMAAALGGLDALVFTGGVGEHAAPVRAAACSGLGFLGVRLDEERNDRREADEDVAAPGATVRVLVVESREDLEIARLVRSALGADSAG
ncbi:MAG: acetate/propionate family kinase [Thermoleophilaceae bacterium]|nr:acetate/propionate family kinase [Thermoleophilaceae bacterium]